MHRVAYQSYRESGDRTGFVDHMPGEPGVWHKVVLGWNLAQGQEQRWALSQERGLKAG